MTVILDLFKWAWKLFWPLIVLFMLIGVHVGTITYMDFDSEFINKTISLATQVIGGFLIFFSINANLKTYRNKNLWSLFVDSLRQGSVSKDEPIIINGGPTLKTLTSEKGEASLDIDPQNVEERIEDIEKMIDDMRNEINAGHQQTNNHLKEEIVKDTNDIKATNSDLSIVESKVIKVSTSGISLQIFGFILMVYCAVSGHIA